MAFRATYLSNDPISYFLQSSDEGPRLRVADVVLRANQNPKEIFSHLIRLATDSHWSHSALLYLINDPPQGFDNTFLVEAVTTGVRVASWRNEVVPYEQFTVGIRRLALDWYAETPKDATTRQVSEREDVPGLAYLRHVRGLALDQINRLYNHNTVDELSALYIQRVARRYRIPFVPTLAEDIANHFKQRDEAVLRFICSGLVQYSFFEALRRRVINDMAVPAHREYALSNLSNLHRIIFHPDPEGIIANYVQQVQSGKLDIAAPVPGPVLDLLKTTTPADLNNTTGLQWRYVIRKGWVWKITEAPAGYQPQSSDEAAVLNLMVPEHASQK
ncbi:MAG: hypothetical protein ACJ788_16330 [Ktedonobacteraceae bacterium]